MTGETYDQLSPGKSYKVIIDHAELGRHQATTGRPQNKNNNHKIHTLVMALLGGQRAVSSGAGLAGEHSTRTLKAKSSSLNTNEVRGARSVGDIKIIPVLSASVYLLHSVPDM